MFVLQKLLILPARFWVLCVSKIDDFLSDCLFVKLQFTSTFFSHTICFFFASEDVENKEFVFPASEIFATGVAASSIKICLANIKSVFSSIIHLDDTFLFFSLRRTAFYFLFLLCLKRVGITNLNLSKLYSGNFPIIWNILFQKNIEFCFYVLSITLPQAALYKSFSW